jgi:hypothetical protein
LVHHNACSCQAQPCDIQPPLAQNIPVLSYSEDEQEEAEFEREMEAIQVQNSIISSSRSFSSSPINKYGK